VAVPPHPEDEAALATDSGLIAVAVVLVMAYEPSGNTVVRVPARAVVTMTGMNIITIIARIKIRIFMTQLLEMYHL